MSVSLRPYVPADARRCAEIFRASIEELAADDYGADQREAWASRADDEAAFAARLAGALTLIAMIDGAAAGFASLKGGDVIDMLYVDPEFAAPGRGPRAVDALTRLAARARREAPHGGGQRRARSRCSNASAFSRREAQSRARRRRMARQHHHDEIARRGTRAANPTLTRTRCPENASISSTRRCATAR